MEVGEKMAELSDRDTINRHESAIQHHEIDIKMHELYVVIKDRVERYGG